jgi:phosphatidylglycerol:prolipoprotein diacylglycerol transferase
MIVMARVYYVVFEWHYYAQDLRRIFSTRDGGLAFYGDIIGGIIAIALVTRIKKIKVHHLLDFLAVYVPLGQAIGRWGNFFNQEAFGNNTALPWGMYSNQTAAYLRSVTNITGLNPTLPVHPTFFYEFAANLLIFAWLLRVRKRSRFPFETTLWYLLLYGFVRYFVEGIRTDPLMIPGTSIRISMLLSALMVIGATIALILLKRRQTRLELVAALAGDAPADETADQEDLTDAEEELDFVAFDEADAQPGAVPDLPATALTDHQDESADKRAADEPASKES